MYLLEAGLEVLHQQSNEWRSEVAFWKDELSFFYKLIAKNKNNKMPSGSKSAIEKTEGELSKIISGELDELQKEVDLHEYFLSQMLGTRKADQRDYRENHKELTIKFTGFEKRFKSLKMEIFKLVESIN